MTITRVQAPTGVNADSASSVSLAFGSNITNGNRIVVMLARYSPTADTPVAGDCTKSAGTATIGAFTLDDVQDINTTGTEHIYTAIWSASVTGTGSCTIDVALASFNYANLEIAEYNSDVGAITLEDHIGTTGTTGAADTGNRTSVGKAVFIGVLNYVSTGAITITPDAAFSQLYEEENGATHNTGSMIERIVASGTTDSASWTSPTNNKWAASLAVYKEPASSGITIGNTASTPVNTGDSNSASPTAITPPSGMASGDLVVVVCHNRITADTHAVSEAGGQSWTKLTTKSDSAGNLTTVTWFWCRFNGTWSADPSFSHGGTNNTCIMATFHPSVGTNTWAMDVAEVTAQFAAPSTPFDVTCTGITTITDGAVAVASFSSRDDNTWAKQTAAWTELKTLNNMAGSDSADDVVALVKVAHGATGDVVSRQTNAAGDAGVTYIAAWKEVSGTQYPQAVDGALTYVGALVKQTGPKKTGALTSGGALAKQTATTKAGAVTFIGALVKQGQKIFSGGLASGGVLATSKLVMQSLAGALTYVGALVKTTSTTKTGALTDSGALTKETRTTKSGALTSDATLVKQTQKIISGALTYVGTEIGSAVKLITLAGALTASGVLVKQTYRLLTGALTSAGALSKQAQKTFSGALTSAGALIRQAGKVTGGALSSAGTLSKQARKVLAGAWSGIGDLVPELISAGTHAYELVVAGVLSMSGALSRQTNFHVAGALSFARSLLGEFMRALRHLTLRPRTVSLTLESRTTVLTLASRAAALTLEGRASALTLAVRSTALTLEEL